MEVEFKPATKNANRKEQGVSISHAEQALRDPRAITIEDPDAGDERRFVSLGVGALGRILVVVHTRSAERTQLISAREASPDEARLY
ncbi:MAG: BrnT family toxin, partial [Gammaproteobacteria bacterium]